MIRVDNLTQGEKLRLWRRRNQIPQRLLARQLKVPIRYPLEWERSKHTDRMPEGIPLPGGLPGWEACYIARFRAKASVEDVARALSVSRITIMDWEAGRYGWERLLSYWTMRGWPDRKGRIKEG